jgi:hypothetical protein
MKKIVLAIFLLTVFALTFNGQTKKSRTVVKKPRVTVSAKILKGSPPKEIKTEPATLGVTFEHYKTDIDVNADGTAVQTWEVRQRLSSAMAVERFANYQRAFQRQFGTRRSSRSVYFENGRLARSRFER